MHLCCHNCVLYSRGTLTLTQAKKNRSFKVLGGHGLSRDTHSTANQEAKYRLYAKYTNSPTPKLWEGGER